MKIVNAVCYSNYINNESPLGYIRLTEPLRRSGINIVNGVIENQKISTNFISEADVIIIQREFPRDFEGYKKIIEIAHKKGKPVVFDLDDNLFYLPENHPDRKRSVFGSSLLPMFQAILEVDLITVSTLKLKNVLTKYNKNILVLPNYFDDNLWRLASPSLKNSSQEILTIGYMGTTSHSPDLEFITPVLLKLIDRFPQKLRFHFYGVQPSSDFGSLSQVEWTPWFSNSYKEFAEFFQSQSADIFIAPLVDNLFNRCKSPLKFFEYSALGVPGIFSNLDPYLDVITHGYDGLIASSQDDWINCLTKLIENDDLRFQLATNAQTTIRENWLLSENSIRWEQALQCALDIKSSHKENNNNLLCLIDSINLQLNETFNQEEAALQALSVHFEEQIYTLNTQLDHSKNEVDHFKNEVEVLKKEVLKYVLSLSWRMTRPIRKIRRKLKWLFGDKNV